MPEGWVRREDHLVWLDLEMTGLEPATDRIIEIAVIVTDAQLDVRVAGPVFAIHQSDAVLDTMDAWNRGTHGKSGLTQRVRESTFSEEEVEARVLEWLRTMVPAGKSPLCGNTIGQDRRFLNKYMPRLENFFHYRNIDVSTLKELARRWKPAILPGFAKAQKHTALADIHESIDEMLYYREHFINAPRI
ncbi:oligoribonuclease [Amphibiibacter pelophylacis]|uniref:Oligoribonuclease n=1 Tax=Amphibiibacter pelophylacis TaxID=1799477 RepID=A0ACC6P2P6_9BURK